MLIIIIFLTGCDGAPKSVSGEQYTNISASELRTMMGSKDLSLINVHIPYEGEIPGTDLFIPYNEIEKLDLPKDSRIVLYCRSGSMSRTASEQLVEHGYTNVFDLKDGMNGWREAGNEIISTPDR